MICFEGVKTGAWAQTSGGGRDDVDFIAESGVNSGASAHLAGVLGPVEFLTGVTSTFSTTGAAFSMTGTEEAGFSTTAEDLSTTGAGPGALVISAEEPVDTFLIGGTSVVFSAPPLAAIAAQPPVVAVTVAGAVTDGAEEFLTGSASGLSTTVAAEVAGLTGKTADFSSTAVGTPLVTGTPQADLTGAATLFVFLEASTTGAVALTTGGLLQTDLGPGTVALTAAAVVVAAVVTGWAFVVLGGRLAAVSCGAGPPRCLPDDVEVDAVEDADEEASLVESLSLSRPPAGTL